MPGVHFAIYNDLDSVKALVNDKTCAIILETIQGEGGINAATKEFMQGIRKICDENGILMICDEVQCGMGRSGAWFAWQQMGITPDIMTMAKAIGSGVPVGAFASSMRRLPTPLWYREITELHMVETHFAVQRSARLLRSLKKSICSIMLMKSHHI